MNKNFSILLFIAIFIAPFFSSVYASEFDELDKPPEGAHQGQMILGGSISIGMPVGNAIDAEKNFLKGSTYTNSNEITKLIEVSYLCFGFGLSFEYMPIDYVGAKAKIKRTVIIEKTNFGSDFENFRGTLYQDVAFYAGPSFHATTRKTWDFTLTPVIGYAIAKYDAVPAAHKILQNASGDKITGQTKKSANNFTFGMELNCTIYFTGGLFVSLGADWTRNNPKFSSAFNITNPQQPEKVYLNGKTSAIIDSLNIVLSSGYAFAN
jgi:hypothetical protein